MTLPWAMVATAVASSPDCSAILVSSRVYSRRGKGGHLVATVQQHRRLGIPRHQLQLGIEDDDALGDVGYRGCQQPRLLGHLGEAAGFFQAAEVGDLGDDGHAAAVVGRALADLNPAAVAQELLELAAFAAMVLDAGGGPGVGVGHRLHDHAGLGRCLDDVPEVGSRLQQVAEQWEEVAVLVIAQNDAIIAVEEDKALADGVDRLLELLAGDLGLAHGAGEALDALLDAGFQLGHRLEQLVGIAGRSEEHTSELQSLMRISYAVFGLKKKITRTI